MTPERYLTAAELGQILGFTAGTILDWYEAGKIPGYRFGAKGGRVRFLWSQVATMLDSSATIGGGQLHEVKG